MGFCNNLHPPRSSFLTLLERKILSLSQERIGPNKVGVRGLVQPILDGVKLLLKPRIILKHNVQILYYFSAWIGLGFNFLLWIVLIFPSLDQREYQILWFVCISGLATYVILLAGWSSLRKYRFVGGVRALAQAISYEIVLTLLFFFPFIINCTFLWADAQHFVFSLLCVWIIIFIMETQRSPFDLAEGERELVSGFNTEYGRLLFTFFFLAEYGNILILRLVRLIIWAQLSWLIIIFVFLWLYFRTSYPRVRYDLLIVLTWFLILPFTLVVWEFFIQA